MENKKILITGATGGIGRSIVNAFLKKRFEIYIQIRSRKKAEKIFGQNSNIHFLEENVEDFEKTVDFLSNLQENDVYFDLVILSAGQIAKDEEFDSQKEAIEKLTIANFLTTKNVILALKKVYGKSLKKTGLVVISSQAANFKVGHLYRKGQEGYVVSKAKQSLFVKKEKKKGSFLFVLLEEPAMIDTQKARSVFSEKDTDWTKALSSENYANLVVSKSIELLESH